MRWRKRMQRVSGKSAKVAARVAGMDSRGWDPRYAGWFECFNRGEFYEAHDVLEDLWLEGGREAPNYAFHKALIQIAGAFVHVSKNRPTPAVALLRLAEGYLTRYPSRHDGVDVIGLRERCRAWADRIAAASPDTEWETGEAPHVELKPKRDGRIGLS